MAENTKFMEFGAVLAWECKGPVLIFVTISLSCLIDLGLDLSACIRVNIVHRRKVVCGLDYYVGLIALVLKPNFFF